jgi:hypothetical protein
MICSTVCFCFAILPSFFGSKSNIELGPIYGGQVTPVDAPMHNMNWAGPHSRGVAQSAALFYAGTSQRGSKMMASGIGRAPNRCSRPFRN